MIMHDVGTEMLWNTFVFNRIEVVVKGQLISKRLLGVFNSPKRRTKNSHFEISLPLAESMGEFSRIY